MSRKELTESNVSVLNGVTGVRVPKISEVAEVENKCIWRCLRERSATGFQMAEKTSCSREHKS